MVCLIKAILPDDQASLRITPMVLKLIHTNRLERTS